MPRKWTNPQAGPARSSRLRSLWEASATDPDDPAPYNLKDFQRSTGHKPGKSKKPTTLMYVHPADLPAGPIDKQHSR